MSLENVKAKFNTFMRKFGARLDVDGDGKIGLDDFTAVYNQDIKKVAIASSVIGVAVGVVIGAIFF